MQQDTKAGLFDYGLLITLAAIFGASFMLTKIAVAEVPPVTIVFLRLLLASMIIGVAMVLAGQGPRALSGFWPIIVLAALFGNALPFFLISWGQERVDAGLAAILMATMPLITVVLAHFATQDERLNAFKVVGFIIGMFGVAVLIGLDNLGSLGEETVRQYAIAGAAVCYAIHAVISKRLMGLPRRALAAAVLCVSALMVLPFSLVMDRPWELVLSFEAVGSIVLLGIFPTAIGTLMLFAIVKRQGAGFLSQINFMVPVFGVLWAAILLSERLPANAFLALVLILSGVAIARIHSLSLPKARSNP